MEKRLHELHILMELAEGQDLWSIIRDKGAARTISEVISISL